MEAAGDARRCPGRALLLLPLLLLLLLPPRGLRSAFGAPGTQPCSVARCPESLTWAVRLTGPEEDLDRLADDLAREARLVNVGRIGELKGHYLLAYRPASASDPPPGAVRRAAEALFARHAGVGWHAAQRLLKRSKRALHFNDPKFPQQWHLVSRVSRWALVAALPRPLALEAPHQARLGIPALSPLVPAAGGRSDAAGLKMGAWASALLPVGVLAGGGGGAPGQQLPSSSPHRPLCAREQPIGGPPPPVWLCEGPEALWMLPPCWPRLLSRNQDNRKRPGMDINVTGVWERNVTGQGVTVVVVDDGVEHTIKDIQPKYVSGCPPTPRCSSSPWGGVFLSQPGKEVGRGRAVWAGFGEPFWVVGSADLGEKRVGGAQEAGLPVNSEMPLRKRLSLGCGDAAAASPEGLPSLELLSLSVD